MKIDRNGNAQWQRTYGEKISDSANVVRPTADGGHIVAGDTRSFGASKSDAWVLKVNQDGVIDGCSSIGKRISIPALNANAQPVDRKRFESSSSVQLLDMPFSVSDVNGTAQNTCSSPKE